MAQPEPGLGSSLADLCDNEQATVDDRTTVPPREDSERSPRVCVEDESRQTATVNSGDVADRTRPDGVDGKLQHRSHAINLDGYELVSGPEGVNVRLQAHGVFLAGR